MTPGLHVQDRMPDQETIDMILETEVWVAESPTHLTLFNGERFLGPYEDAPFGFGKSLAVPAPEGCLSVP
jgi:hypothetical protein